MATEIQVVVGKLVARMAIFITEDDRLIDFPASLTPSDVQEGAVLNVRVERDKREETKRHKDFLKLQEAILEMYGTMPETPEIFQRGATQTSVTIEWKPLRLNNAELRGIEVFRNKQKTMAFSKLLDISCVRLTGLEVNKEYDLYLVFRTSAGVLETNHIIANTRALNDLRGVNAAVVGFEPGELKELQELLDGLGGTVTTNLTTESTHLITNTTNGKHYEQAQSMNIPIVTAQWLRECASHGAIRPVSGFYVAAVDKDQSTSK